MATRGAKPTEGPKLGRTPVAHDWTQVPNQPYRGKKPALPTSREFLDREGSVRTIPLSTLTKAWWKDIAAMPHCVLWTPTDWRFAIETALIADMLFSGDRAAASELRLRERVLGTTLDSRRDLRIRYVTPGEQHKDEESRRPRKAPTKVTNIADRRKRLLTDAD